MYKVSLRTKGRIISVLYVLYLIWELVPYFTWITYRKGRLGYFFGVPLQYIFALLVIFVYFVWNAHIHVSKRELQLIAGVLFLGILHTTVCGLNIANILSTIWIRYFMVVMFILFPIDLKMQIFNLYKAFFAITLVPAIIYSIFNFGGITLPHDYIEPIEEIKSNNFYTYIHYPFGIQLCNSVRFDPISPYRLCGIYNEAGAVGTMCALLLTADRYQIKRKWDNIVLLIGGILSFSFAFYLMVGLYFVLVNIGKHKFKNALALGLVLTAIILFMNVDFLNPALSSIQSRMQFTQEGLAGDNRTNERFNEVFSEVYDDSLAFFIGFGMGTIGTIQRNRFIDGSSYKCLIYDYGYIGFGLFLLWLFFAVKVYKRKKNIDILILFFIYVLNIYQRPTMFYPSYLVILLGGCINLNKEVCDSLISSNYKGIARKYRGYANGM